VNFNSEHASHQRSDKEKMKDIMSKGHIPNKERDSLILSKVKERDSNEGLNLALL
jgi:hypothetical protein